MKIRNHIYILCLLIVLGGCEREFESEGVSRTTTYPTFEMAGEEIIVIVKDDAYTDPGIIATEGGAEIPVEKSVVGSSFIEAGSTQPEDVTYRNLTEVDASTPGIYTVTYSAVNSDGFAGTVQRTVFVLESAPDPAVDLTGGYTSGVSPEAEITKIADGVFYSTNVWGGGSSVKIGGYILTSDGVNVNVPQQESLVRIFGYGTRDGSGNLHLLMSRPTFGPPPLIDLVKDWTKKP